MLVQCLKTYQDFADLSLTDLRLVARHTQLISIPSDRWLTRPGRRLTGVYYLHRGRLRCEPRLGDLVAGSEAASRAFYPGCNSILTRSAVQILRVNLLEVAFLLRSGEPARWLPDHIPEGWEQRFLGSRLMRSLQPAAWQQILRTMSERRYESGSRVIRQGDTGATFYVLKSGHCVVHRGGKTLSFLNPGDFFGEDALITGGLRNADVTLLEDSVLMLLPKDAFLKLLVAAVVRVAQQSDRGVFLNIGSEPIAGMRHLPIETFRQGQQRLDLSEMYYCVGGTLPERALAAFLLAQQGAEAWVVTQGATAACKDSHLQAGTVRPFAQTLNS